MPYGGRSLQKRHRGICSLLGVFTVEKYYWVYWYSCVLFRSWSKLLIGNVPGQKINASFRKFGISLAIWPQLLTATFVEVVSNLQHVSRGPGNTTDKSKANDKQANQTYASPSTHSPCQLFVPHPRVTQSSDRGERGEHYNRVKDKPSTVTNLSLRLIG